MPRARPGHRPRRRRWPLVGGVLTLLTATVIGWYVQPEAGYVRAITVQSSREIHNADPTDRWSIELSMSGSVRSPWMVHEGQTESDGLVVEWVSDLPGLQVWYGSEPPILIASYVLTAPPSEVVIERNRSRLRLQADRVLLGELLVPMANRPVAAWGFVANGGIMQAGLRLTPMRSADARQAAQRARAANLQSQWAAAVDDVPTFRELARTSPARGWKALDSAIQAAAADDVAGYLAATHMIVAFAQQDRDAQCAGRLLAAMPAALKQAERRPAAPVDPQGWARRRQAWLAALYDVAQAVDRHAQLTLVQRQWLHFISHASSVLSGGARRPLIVDGALAPWLEARWRLLAGDDPGAMLPVVNTVRDPLAQIGERLVALSGRDPLSAIAMRGHMEQMVFADDPLIGLAQAGELLREAATMQPGTVLAPSATLRDLRRAACASAPLTEVRLTRALLAAHAAGLAMSDASRRREAIDIARAHLRGLEESEHEQPLLSTLIRLAWHRLAQADPRAVSGLSSFSEFAQSAALQARWGAILNGQRDPDDPLRDAAAQAMLVDPEVMALDRALTMALAAQEMQGHRPDWNSLRPWLGRTLALRLAIPPSSTLGTDDTPFVP